MDGRSRISGIRERGSVIWFATQRKLVATARVCKATGVGFAIGWICVILTNGNDKGVVCLMAWRNRYCHDTYVFEIFLGVGRSRESRAYADLYRYLGLIARESTRVTADSELLSLRRTRCRPPVVLQLFGRPGP